MQERRSASRTRRVLAAIVGTWLVVSGALGVRHEAQIGHVLDSKTGLVVHTQRIVGHHDASKQSDIHRQADDNGDSGVCPLSAALLQAASLDVARPTVADPCGTPFSVELPFTRLDLVASLPRYRIAPKTSPPDLG